MADSPTWVWINRICVIVGTLAALACAYYAREAYLLTIPANASPQNGGVEMTTSILVALFFGVACILLLTVGVVGLVRRSATRGATPATLEEVESLLATLKNQHVTAQATPATRAARTATERQFLRHRWWYALWAPILYKAKRRLEFIEAWEAYFAGPKATQPLATGFDFVIAEIPDAIYRLAMTPKQIEQDIRARIPAAEAAARTMSKVVEPNVQESKSSRDVYLLDAIWRAHVGKWETPNFSSITSAPEPRPNFWSDLGDIFHKDFRQAAFDGRLPIWGKPISGGVWKPISPAFWEHNWVNWYDFLKGDRAAFRTEPDHPKNPLYWNELMTNKAAVDALWPVKCVQDQPIKTTALALEDPKFSFSVSHDGVFERGECTIKITNKSKVTLTQCRAEVETISDDGFMSDVRKPLRTGTPFSVAASSSKKITIARRDLKDIIANPPWLLKLEPGDYPLLEGHEYRLTILLRSEHQFPTKVLLQLSIGAERNVRAKIVSQTV